MVNKVISVEAWEDRLWQMQADIASHDPRVMVHNKFQMNQKATAEEAAQSPALLADRRS